MPKRKRKFEFPKFKYGNRCGHNPAVPNLFLTKPLKDNLPSIIPAAIERVNEYYDRPAAFLPSLNDTNDSDRQQRSERREACIRVLHVLLRYLDVVTLMVMIPDKVTGIISPPTFEFIAHAANIDLRRCERAVENLKEAGILKVDERAEEQEDGTYNGLAAIKSITEKFFEAIGLDKWLKRSRKQLSDRLSKKEKKARQLPQSQNKRAWAKYTLGFNVNKSRRRTNPAFQEYRVQQDMQLARLLMAKALAIKEANPDWPAARCNEEARKSLKID